MKQLCPTAALMLLVGCSLFDAISGDERVDGSVTPSDDAARIVDARGTDGSLLDAQVTDGPLLADAAQLCEPDGADNTCVECMKGSCCDELVDCEADATCACVLACLGSGGTTFSCNNMCGAQGNTPTSNLFACVSNDVCGDCEAA